jgi:hypothetical protein
VNVKPRSPSVAVSSKWEIKAEIDFLQLAKLNFNPEEPKELYVSYIKLLGLFISYYVSLCFIQASVWVTRLL